MFEIIDLLRAATSKRITRGSTGVALSGGLDSSTVASLALQMDPDIPVFTGWYDCDGYDERSYARTLLARNHHEVRITPEDFVENFEAMRDAMLPPVMGMGTFGQFMVAKYASRHIDAMLSGEGSDELFGGYARQVIVAGEAPPEGYENYQLPAGYPTTLREALDYDYAKLPDLLAVDDQMCAAWGIEARAPFTDPSVVEFALALPVEARVGKRYLRAAVRGLVPDVVIGRKNKMGFPIPLVLWAQEEPVRSFVLERIDWLPDPEKPYDRQWWLELVGM